MASYNIGTSGDYTTIAAWVSAADVSTGTWEGVLIDSKNYNENISLTSVTGTPSATNYVKLSAGASVQHDGTPSTGAHIDKNSGSNFTPLASFTVNYTKVHFVSFKNTRNSNQLYGGAFSMANVTDGEAIGIIAYQSNAGSRAAPARIYGTGSKICDSLLLGGGASDYGVYGSDTNWNYYQAINCVASGCDYGFAGGNNQGPLLINCAAYGNNTQDFHTTVTNYNASSDRNGSEDTTASTLFTNNVTGVASTDFNASASNDFHLSGTSSALYNVGQNASTYSSVDIDNETWSTWNIGMDHITAAANVTGSASITLGGLNINSAADIGVSGAAGFVLGDVSVDSVVSVDLAAGSVFTLSDLSLSGAGSVSVSAGAVNTLAPLTLNASGLVGSLPVTASAALSLDPAALSAAVGVGVSVTADFALDAVSVNLTAGVDVFSTASIALDNLALSSGASVSLVATAGLSLEGMTLSATGLVSSGPPIVASAAFTLDNLVLDGSGTVVTQALGASANIILDPLSVSVQGAVDVAGSAAVALDDLLLDAVAGTQVLATLLQQLAPLTVDSTGRSYIVVPSLTEEFTFRIRAQDSTFRIHAQDSTIRVG